MLCYGSITTRFFVYRASCRFHQTPTCSADLDASTFV